MTTVIHYNSGHEPDIYFGISEKIERKIINNLSKTHNISRCSPEEWYGQDNPNYDIHHWNASKIMSKRRN